MQWCETWQLQLAPEKCGLCRVGNKSSLNSINTHYFLNNTSIKRLDSVSDLGVTVDNSMKFDKHVCLITHKAFKRVHLILKCFSSRNKDLLVRAYITYARPILEYSSPVWSPHHKYLINKLEQVQKYFTKRIPGLWNQTYHDRLKIL